MQLTSEQYAEIARDYRTHADELAKYVGQIEYLQESCDSLSDLTKDDGAPAYSLQEALMKLGSALAAMLVYASEYEKLAAKGNPTE